jgi:hypothetical protein
MIRFIHGNWLLSLYQSGFGSGHSTAKALLKITNDIQRDCDRRLVTLLLLLLDFSRAFKNVGHSLLLINFHCTLTSEVLRGVLIFQIDISVCLWLGFFRN